MLEAMEVETTELRVDIEALHSRHADEFNALTLRQRAEVRALERQAERIWRRTAGLGGGE